MKIYFLTKYQCKLVRYQDHHYRNISRAVFSRVQRIQSNWISQSDGPQEKNYCSISPPPLKKEK